MNNKKLFEVRAEVVVYLLAATEEEAWSLGNKSINASMEFQSIEALR